MKDTEFLKWIESISPLQLVTAYLKLQDDLGDMSNRKSTPENIEIVEKTMFRMAQMETAFERKLVAINKKYETPLKDMKNET